MATPPPIPRVTGDANRDMVSLYQWANDFYRAVVLEETYAKSTELTAVQTNLTNLIDPTAATAASAQATANSALNLATVSDSILDLQDAGEFTISGTNTTSVVTIPTQPNTSYFVTFSGAGYTGGPPLSAFTVISISKTTSQFTATINTAPGVGNSVTLAWQVQR